MKKQEILSQLSDSQIQNVIRELDPKHFHLAIEGMEPALRERFLQNLEKTIEAGDSHSEDVHETDVNLALEAMLKVAGKVANRTRIAIASDHAGYELKQNLIPLLAEYSITDFGAHSNASIDYPDTGRPAADAVASGLCDLGILICGSGIGMSIVANKVPGIRAALCWIPEIARLSRQHNDANVLVLPGRFIGTFLAREIVEEFLSGDFEGGRHQTRIGKIENNPKK